MNELTFHTMYVNVVKSLYNNSSSIERLLKFGGKEKLCDILYDDENLLVVTHAMNTDASFAAVMFSNEVLVMTNIRFLHLKKALLGVLVQEIPWNDKLSVSWSGGENRTIHLSNYSKSINLLLENEGAFAIKKYLYNGEKSENIHDYKDKTNDYIYCINCGEKIDRKSNFCFKCGAKISSVGYSDIKRKDDTREYKDDQEMKKYTYTILNKYSISFTAEQYEYMTRRSLYEGLASELKMAVKSSYEDLVPSEIDAFTFFRKNIDNYISFTMERIIPDVHEFEDEWSKDELERTLYKMVEEIILGVNSDNVNLRSILIVVDKIVHMGWYMTEFILQEHGMKSPFEESAEKKAIDEYKAAVTALENQNRNIDYVMRKLCNSLQIFPFIQWPYAYMYRINKDCANDIMKLALDVGLDIEINEWIDEINNNHDIIPGYNA